MNYELWRHRREEQISQNEFTQPSDSDVSPIAYVKEFYADDYYKLLEWNDSLKVKMSIRELSLDNLLALLIYVNDK